MEHSENERIAKLEVLVEHLTTQQDQMSIKVDEMCSILQNIKGAKWVILVIAGFAGFLISKVELFSTFFMSGKP